MTFLYLENGNVSITPEGLSILSVKRLQQKKNTKDHLPDIITFIYWMYGKANMYSNILPEKRKDVIIANQCPAFKPALLADPDVTEIINLYQDTQLSPMDLLYDGLKADIEQLLRHLKNIPFFKKQKVTFNVEYEGEPKAITQLVDVDNSKEKENALRMAKNLIVYEGELKTLIYKDEKKKNKGQKRLFET